MSTLDGVDDFWEDLLARIEERRVIPVIGPDLVRVEQDGQEMPITQAVAIRLRDRLRIEHTALPSPSSLNDVVCEYVRRRGRREDVYPKIRALMKEWPLQPPAVLQRLAAIQGFGLFVSLTFDSLLVEALNQQRFGGAARTEHLAYSPGRMQDLSSTTVSPSAPVVYALFGKLSVAPDYVITEEDTLEFLCALQSDARRPHHLFDELQGNDLLFIGCPFPNWLARFFIRIAKSRQLSAQRGETEIVVDDSIPRDRELVVFLENFSYGTKIAHHHPVDFVVELHRRWVERHPPGAALVKGSDASADGLPEMEPGSIFVSYAKEDLRAVETLKQGLENLGIETWFDKQRLEAGDLYDAKIRRNIKACSLFLPVISANAVNRLEGYFRREWRLADERTMGIAEGVPFVLPVVIDDTPEYCERVPESFTRAQWTRLRDGNLTPEFESTIVRLVRNYRKREKGLA